MSAAKRKGKRPRRPIDTMGGVRLLLRRSSDGVKREALSRPLKDDEERMLIIPVRVSMAALLEGKAGIDDLHNVAAFMNVGLLLASNTGEVEAAGAIQAGIFSVCAVKDRPGSRYGVNAEQRLNISEAVALTDELFCCSTLLEIQTAHKKVLSLIPSDGQLRPLEVEI